VGSKLVDVILRVEMAVADERVPRHLSDRSGIAPPVKSIDRPRWSFAVALTENRKVGGSTPPLATLMTCYWCRSFVVSGDLDGGLGCPWLTARGPGWPVLSARGVHGSILWS
jgi:hypothetical protein